VPDSLVHILRRLARRFLLALGAATLLWIGLGQPSRARPLHHAQWIEADGVQTRALIGGRGDTTLLFLHGYGESLLSWRLLLDRFTRHYRVIAVDLPGFGISRGTAFGYDYPSYARWLDSVLARYTHGPVVVVGHSMGGELAAGLALDRPDRVLAAVLLAPAGAGINPMFSDTSSIASPAARWLASALSHVMPVHDSSWLSEGPGMAAFEPATDSATQTAARLVLERFDFAALDHRFGELKQPVLLIWGRQDPTIPIGIGERIAAVLPCRRFVRLFTLHRPHQTLPDTVAAEMAAFLRDARCE
jgi:pyruvate dehydrogenase E2 component (dihydrolipoamide acetyltransferase)